MAQIAAKGVPVGLSVLEASAVLIVRALHGLSGGLVRWEKATPEVVPDPVAVPVPAAWAAFPLPVRFICPMCAQLSLLRGAAWGFSAGALDIGGALLMGRAGGVFAFASAATAARWVQINKDRAAAELSAVAAMTATEGAAWRAGRAGLLQVYAAQVVSRAAGVADADKRAALVAESNYALLKWGAA